MGTQDILLLLADYVEQGLDDETAAVLEHELRHHPKGILFLMNYRQTLSFYKRHRQHKEQVGWMVDYLEQRMPKSLRELVLSLPAPALSHLVSAGESTIVP